MGKKEDISDFERGMVVGARWAGLSISKTGIFMHNHLGLTENGPKKRKYPVSGSCVDENALIVDVRGQRRMGRLVRDDRKATVTQITTRYEPRYAGYHLWTHNTSNPEADGLQKTTPGAAPVS